MRLALAPEALSLSGIAAVAAAGSWYVLLPTRAAAGGLPSLVGGLARAVDAVRRAVGAGPLRPRRARDVGAHRPAPRRRARHHAPRHGRYAARWGSILDQAQTSDAIRLLHRLTLAPDGGDPALAALLDTLSAAQDGYVARPDGTPVHVPLPVDDFAPPVFPVMHADTMFARAFVGGIASATFEAALATVVLSVLEGAADGLPGWTRRQKNDRRPPMSASAYALRWCRAKARWVS